MLKYHPKVLTVNNTLLFNVLQLFYPTALQLIRI